MLEFQQSTSLRLMNSTTLKSKPVLPMWRVEARKLKAVRDYSFILSDDAKNPTSGVQSAFSSFRTKKHLDERKESCEAKSKKLMPNQLQSSRYKAPYEHKISLSKMPSVASKSVEQNQKFPQVMPKLVKSITKSQTPDGHKPSSSRSLIATKRKSERKIESAEPKKARVMQNKLQSSLKVQAYDVHKTSLSKPNKFVTRRQSEPEKELREPKKVDLVPRKLQPSLQSKVLNEVQTKQQMTQAKELHKANKEKLIPAQAKSVSKHQVHSLSNSRQVLQTKRPVREPCYEDEVDMSYISSLCQNIFRHNPAKQVANDDSDDCMVSSFNDILKEERKSARIAREEDRIEQLRLEREEREQKIRRKAKQQKPPYQKH